MEFRSAVSSVVDTIGRTPLLRLKRLSPEREVWAKLEAANPGGSSKDRIVHALLDRAVSEGRLSAGGTVVDATSGSLGVALTWACAARGFKLAVAMPRSMSLEKRQALRAHGAKLLLTDADAHLEGAIAEAKAYAAKEGACFLGQFDAAFLAGEYERTLGAEVVEAFRSLGREPSAFVCGYGTGATFTGTARALKAAFPRIRCVLVEPASVPHRQQGLGPGFVPAGLDRSLADETVTVDDVSAWRMKERLAREEGALCGISSGTHVAAALRLADRHAPVVTLLPDTGERYFSMAPYFS